MVTARPGIRYQALVLLAAALMVGAALNSLNGFWRLQTPGTALTIFVIMGVGFGWAWWRSTWLGLAVTLGAGAAGILGVLYLPEWSEFLRQVDTEGQTLLNNLVSGRFNSTFGQSIGVSMLLLIGLGVGWVTLQEALGRGKAFWSIAVGALIFGTQWAWFYERSELYFVVYVVLAFALWVLAQAARRDAAWVSAGRQVGYRNQIGAPLTGVVAIALVATILPTQFAPINLGAWGNSLQEAFPLLKSMRGGGVGGFGGGFSLRYTGFSPIPGMLGGPVKIDNTQVLTLNHFRQITETVYLRGVAHQTYDGRRWDGGDTTERTVGADGTLTSEYASGVFLEDTSYTVTMDVPFGSTLFSPLEIKRLDELGMDFTVDSDWNMISSRSLKKDASYDVTARVPDYSAEQIRSLSTEAPPQALGPYLALPDSLPQRVGQLAKDLTAEHQHPLDKALALETYLRSFDYDLNMPVPPDNRDFVDYFLFDEQRGYCTYFATSMVVMLREVGIPARLVEGFAVPPGADATRKEDGSWNYSVRNAYAHAWVEAYFPGYGWVTFEPTPRDDFPTIDRSRPLPTQTEVPDPETDPSDTDPNNTLPDAPQDEPEDFGNFGGGGSDTEGNKTWPWAVSSVLALGGLLFLGYRRLAIMNRIKSAPGDQVVQEVWEKSDGVMDRFGFGRKPYQTPHEYAETLGRAWPSLKGPAVEVAADYTAARYSPTARPAPDGAEQRARSFWGELLSALFTKYGWRKYLWARLGRPRKK